MGRSMDDAGGMRRRNARRPVALTAVVGMLLGCAPGTPGDNAGEAASRQVRSQTAALFAAQTRGDLEATVGFFADDAVLHVGGSPTASGIAEIRAFYARVLSFLESAEAESLVTDVARSGDVAYDLGRLASTFGRAEAAQRFDGHFLIVWKRQTETWKIAALALTSGPD
jgi:ketosteroid isomerase-like protein